MASGKEATMKKASAIVAVVMAVVFMASTASAQELKFNAELTGAQERPTPVETEGEGEAKFETDGTVADFELKWKNLTASAFAAHIHCGGPEEAGPVGVTLFTGSKGTEGEVEGSFTGADPGNRCGWVTLADVLEAMAAGDTYVNVHSTNFPGGEIRGQVTVD
jgi:hypothetical protein